MILGDSGGYSVIIRVFIRDGSRVGGRVGEK